MRADLTQSPGNGWPEIRAENALFGVMLENARFARGWVVVCAVPCEPVSTEYFPVLREFNREIRDF
jgi:hypothetical protein